MNSEVEQVVQNWIAKAENDLKIGADQMKTDDPVTDMVCYHMQQCAEKYLKAFLMTHGVPFRRTHDIAELIQLCLEKDETFIDLYAKNVDRLTVYAVEIRYPDFFYMPTQEETTAAIAMAQAVRRFIRGRLFSAEAEEDAN